MPSGPRSAARAKRRLARVSSTPPSATSPRCRPGQPDPARAAKQEQEQQRHRTRARPGDRPERRATNDSRPGPEEDEKEPKAERRPEPECHCRAREGRHPRLSTGGQGNQHNAAQRGDHPDRRCQPRPLAAHQVEHHRHQRPARSERRDQRHHADRQPPVEAERPSRAAEARHQAPAEAPGNRILPRASSTRPSASVPANWLQNATASAASRRDCKPPMKSPTPSRGRRRGRGGATSLCVRVFVCWCVQWVGIRTLARSATTNARTHEYRINSPLVANPRDT